MSNLSDTNSSENGVFVRTQPRVNPQTQSANVRDSQESRASSTPMRNSQNVIPTSPGLSAVDDRSSSSGHEQSVPMLTSTPVRSSHVPVPFPQMTMIHRTAEELPISERSITTSLSSSTVYSESVSQPTKKTKIVKNKGKDWELFKPLRSESCYYDILMKPEETEERAWLLVESYSDNKKQAVLEFLQFLVDICGFQNFSIEEHFVPEEENYEEVINNLQKNIPAELHYPGKYLFRGSTEWCRHAQDVICDFVMNVFKQAHRTKILYDRSFIMDVAFFIKNMSLSNIRSIRHTSVVIAVKVITALVHIFFQIVGRKNDLLSIINKNNMENILNDSQYVRCKEQIQEFTEDEQQVSKFLGYFNKIFQKNCCLDDSALDDMRAVCASEIWQWFSRYPDRYFSCMKQLMRFVEDTSKKVRLNALQTWKHILETVKYHSFLVNIAEAVLNTIGNRIFDVDYNVAICAVEIYTVVIYTYPRSISIPIRNAIMQLTFHYKSYPLASAAANFTCRYFKSLKENMSDEEFFQYLIRFLQLRGVEGLVPLFVEASLESCKELQNWDFMITMLLKDNLELPDETILVNILCQSIIQSITGKCPIRRLNPREGKTKAHVNKEIVAKLFPKLHFLLDKYKPDMCNVKSILEMVRNIKCEDISNVLYRKPLSKLYEFMIHSAVDNDDEDLLDCIGQLFANFMEADHGVFDSVISGSRILTGSLAKRYGRMRKEYIQSGHATEKDIDKIESFLLKLKVFFRHINLCKSLPWDTIFYEWFAVEYELPVAAITHLIENCQHFLKWQLLDLLKQEDNNDISNSVKDLLGKTNDFIRACFDLLQYDSRIIRNKGFNSICDVCLIFSSKTRVYLEANEQLKVLDLKITDKQQQDLLMKFIQDVVFGDEPDASLLLKFRRTCLSKMIRLIRSRIIPITYFPQLYVHYYTHNEDYQQLFDEGLQWSEHNMNFFNAVVVKTISIAFENIPITNDTSTANTIDTDNLKCLVKQFQRYMGDKRKYNVREIILMGICYAKPSLETHSFLRYLKYLIPSLEQKHRQPVLEILKGNIPAKNMEHHSVSQFVTHLGTKGGRRGRNSATPKRDQEVSGMDITTVDESEQVTIEDGSDMDESNVNM